VAAGVGGAKIGSPLMLGKNNEGEAVFKGAIDQVQLWNRTLSVDEINKYMHQRSFLNENGLVSYVNFDNLIDGSYMDLKSAGTVSFNGSVTTNFRSPIPFAATSQQKRTRLGHNDKVADGVGFTIPTSYSAIYPYYTTFFPGNPYNYLNTKYPNAQPLENGYRTIAFSATTSFKTTETITLTVENEAIQAGDSVAIALPATLFNSNQQYMLFRSEAPNAIADQGAHRYKVVVDNGRCLVQNLRGKAKVSILDMNGREIVVKSGSDSSYRFELNTGSYFIKIEEMGTTCVEKIII
jgi:hypothetical protein